MGATTVRPADAEDGAPPPPPYSRADPDPDSTRILQEQLASVPGVTGEGAAVPSTPTAESAAQREQREVDEAIRLSVEAERQAPSGPAGAQALGSPVGASPGHRRVQSEAVPLSSHADGLADQMQGLSMPGAFQSSGRANALNTASVLSPINAGTNNPFLQPTHSAASPQQGSSRNPFSDPPRAGSSHTVYAPPPGPPPHLSAKSPLSPSTPQTAGSVSSGRRGSLERHFSQSGRENPLEMLRKYDTVLLVDDSGSMAGGRWRETKAALMDVAEQAAIYDHDGIDLHFINSERVGMGLTVGTKRVRCRLPRSDCVHHRRRLTRWRTCSTRSSRGARRREMAVQPSARFLLITYRASRSTGYRLERILLEYMNQLEQITALERAGQMPRGEGVKPMNLVSPSRDVSSLGRLLTCPPANTDRHYRRSAHRRPRVCARGNSQAGAWHAARSSRFLPD